MATIEVMNIDALVMCIQIDLYAQYA